MQYFCLASRPFYKNAADLYRGHSIVISVSADTTTRSTFWFHFSISRLAYQYQTSFPLIFRKQWILGIFDSLRTSDWGPQYSPKGKWWFGKNLICVNRKRLYLLRDMTYELTVLRGRGARELVKDLTQKVFFQFEGKLSKTHCFE